MSRPKLIVSSALGVFGLCLFATGVLWAWGAFSPNLSADEVSREIAERRVAAAREEISKLLDAAPRMTAAGLKKASHTAKRADQLDVAGFFAFASQARLTIDDRVYPGPAPSRIGLFFLNGYEYWMAGSKADVIWSLEEHPDDYVAAIDRFLAWRPAFDSGYDPGWKYENAKTGEAREQVVIEVLQDFQTGLKKRARNYSNPEFAEPASAYARVRKELLVLHGSSRDKMSDVEYEAFERRISSVRDRFKEHRARMQDLTWKFFPQSRWQARAGLRAADYFDTVDSLALCYAIEADDVEQIEQLIAAGADVNRVGKGGMTALLWAMPDYRFKRFECLLRHGADPNVFLTKDFEAIRHPMYLDLDRLGPLGGYRGCGPADSVTHLALGAPIEYLRLVLEHGGDPNLRHPDTNLVPLDMAGDGLVFAVDNSQTGLLLEYGADPELTDPPLVLKAMSRGSYLTTLRLLRAGVDPASYGADRLIKFNADLGKALAEANSFKPPRDAASALRRKQLAEIVAWMKAHRKDVSIPPVEEGTAR